MCPVYFANTLHPQPALQPNPDEVMDWTWASWSDMRTAMAAAPFAFSPWAVLQAAELAQHDVFPGRA